MVKPSQAYSTTSQGPNSPTLVLEPSRITAWTSFNTRSRSSHRQGRIQGGKSPDMACFVNLIDM